MVRVILRFTILELMNLTQVLLPVHRSMFDLENSRCYGLMRRR